MQINNNRQQLNSTQVADPSHEAITNLTENRIGAREETKAQLFDPMTTILELSSYTSPKFSCNNPAHQIKIEDLSNIISNSIDSVTSFEQYQESLATLLSDPKRKNFVNPCVALAVRNACSRFQMLQIAEPIEIRVVAAMYTEHERMREASQHPNGEDFIQFKTKQLEWLTKDTPHRFTITLVDDFCPKNSGELAINRAKTLGYSHVEVLHLEDAIRAGSPGARHVYRDENSHKGWNSIKGGAIHYGLWHAAQKECEGATPILLFTDCDLSTDLRMSGSLIDLAVNSSAQYVSGHRYLPSSIMQQGTDQNAMSAPWIQHFVTIRQHLRNHLLPNLQSVTNVENGQNIPPDVNCGFKVIDSALYLELHPKLKIKSIDFDLEIIHEVTSNKDNKIGYSPIVWMDSPDAATSRHRSFHHMACVAIANIYLAGLTPATVTPDDTLRYELAQKVEALTLSKYESLIDRLCRDNSALPARGSIPPIESLIELFA